MHKHIDGAEQCEMSGLHRHTYHHAVISSADDTVDQMTGNHTFR